jgi:hypothetical protein
MSFSSQPSAQIDLHHKAEIESLQPFWIVMHGGAPGLSAEDREAWVRGRVPPSYVALGIRQLAHAGTYFLILGIPVFGTGITLAAFGEWLLGALIGFVGGFCSVMGWMFRRGATRSPSDYPAAYDRPAPVVVGWIRRKWSRGGQGGAPTVCFIELEQLVFTVDSDALWERLRVGACYRCWYLPIAVEDRTGTVLWVEPWGG